MAIRNLRFNDDEILRKKCRVVDDINDRIKVLVEDMIETMYENNGVGLAAPQVGILKRIFVIDIGDENGVMVFINPEILETSGTQCDDEGCLSIPGETKQVERPNYVKVRALDVNGNEFVLDAEEFLARAIQHEYDHLEGVLFIDHEL